MIVLSPQLASATDDSTLKAVARSVTDPQCQQLLTRLFLKAVRRVLSFEIANPSPGRIALANIRE